MVLKHSLALSTGDALSAGTKSTAITVAIAVSIVLLESFVLYLPDESRPSYFKLLQFLF